MKQEKGITLVALIITIIMLLILAGITINLVLGDNGILNRAKNSGIQYNKAATKEKIELAIVDIQLEEIEKGNNLTMDKIIEKLPSKIEGITIRKEGALGKGTCDGYIYTIKRDFEVVMDDIEDPIKTILSLDKTNMELYQTETQKITAIVEQTDNRKVTWKSDNETIAIVDSNGMVTAKQGGETKITATTQDGSQLSESCTIVIEWSKPYEITDNYSDGTNTAMIPKGFQVSLKETMNTIEKGLVVRNASDNNEFVWIPLEDIANYVRVDFKKQQGTYSQYSEILASDEKESIEKYKGYYIGRYEAGTDTKRTAAGNTLTTMLVQKNKEVYNFVRMDESEKLATELYSKQQNNVQSKLCSSYAWDTALKFIQIQNGTWINNSVGGNYTSVLKTTGQTTAVNNIYDMGGNVWEWTIEKSTHSYGPCVTRRRKI